MEIKLPTKLGICVYKKHIGILRGYKDIHAHIGFGALGWRFAWK